MNVNKLNSCRRRPSSEVSVSEREKRLSVMVGWQKKSQRYGIVYLEQETMELGSLVCSPKEVWKLKEDGQTGRAKWYISLKESSAIKIEKKQLSSRKVLEHAQEHSDKYMGLQWVAKNKPDYTLRSKTIWQRRDVKYQLWMRPKSHRCQRRKNSGSSGSPTHLRRNNINNINTIQFNLTEIWTP